MAKVFEEFQKITGLHLNFKKSVIIPLGSLQTAQFVEIRDNTVPTWTEMPVSDHCKYLGFMVGPGKKTYHGGNPCKSSLTESACGRRYL